MVPTKDRPRKLDKLLASIHENIQINRYAGKVSVVVVDDSQESQNMRQNRDNIARRLERMGGKVPIYYYDRNDQAELVRDIEKRGGDDVQRFVYEQGTTKGYGGVRNMALLFATQHVRPQDIVTFLDDDVSLKNMVIEEQHGRKRIRIRHDTNYFGNVDRIFSNPQVKVAGGGYTADDHFGEFESLKWGLVAIDEFLSAAKQNKSTEYCDRTMRAIWRHSPVHHMSFRSGLELVVKLTQGMLQGKQRFDMRVNRGEEFATSYLAGGNLSVRADVLRRIPYPSMAGGRGEDVVFTALTNHLWKDSVWFYPNPVSHRKDALDTSTSGGRRSIFKHAALDTAPHPIIWSIMELSTRGNVLETLRRRPQEARRVFNSKVSEVRNWFQRDYLSEMDRRIQSIKEHLAQSVWYNQGESAETTEELRKLVDKIEEGYHELKERVVEVTGNERLKDALIEYPQRIERWRELMEIAEHRRMRQAA